MTVEKIWTDAYGLMPVGDRRVCWEGRITEGVLRADDLIKSGKYTLDQVVAVLDTLEQRYAAAMTAIWRLEQQQPDAFVGMTRPDCGCVCCQERRAQ